MFDPLADDKSHQELIARALKRRDLVGLKDDPDLRDGKMETDGGRQRYLNAIQTTDKEALTTDGRSVMQVMESMNEAERYMRVESARTSVLGELNSPAFKDDSLGDIRDPESNKFINAESSEIQIRDFQLKAGLETSGKWDKETKEYVRSLMLQEGVSFSPEPLPESLQGIVDRNIVMDYSLNKGGTWQLAEQISDFQEYAGLQRTGSIDEATVNFVKEFHKKEGIENTPEQTELRHIRSGAIVLDPLDETLRQVDAEGNVTWLLQKQIQALQSLLPVQVTGALDAETLAAVQKIQDKYDIKQIGIDGNRVIQIDAQTLARIEEDFVQITPTTIFALQQNTAPIQVNNQLLAVVDSQFGQEKQQRTINGLKDFSIPTDQVLDEIGEIAASRDQDGLSYLSNREKFAEYMNELRADFSKAFPDSEIEATGGNDHQFISAVRAAQRQSGLPQSQRLDFKTALWIRAMGFNARRKENPEIAPPKIDDEIEKFASLFTENDIQFYGEVKLPDLGPQRYSSLDFPRGQVSKVKPVIYRNNNEILSSDKEVLDRLGIPNDGKSFRADGTVLSANGVGVYSSTKELGTASNQTSLANLSEEAISDILRVAAIANQGKSPKNQIPFIITGANESEHAEHKGSTVDIGLQDGKIRKELLRQGYTRIPARIGHEAFTNGNEIWSREGNHWHVALSSQEVVAELKGKPGSGRT